MKVLDQASGSSWSLYHADAVDVLAGLPDNSVHYSIFSPPFVSLYVFSDSLRDMGNVLDSKQFFEGFQFLAAELYRVMMPGRLVSIHCMDLPTSKQRDGFIGLYDFPSDLRQCMQDHGFIYHSKIVIRKDPVAAMQRSKAIGLLHKQVVKDSALSRQAMADCVITMRKPGANPEPVAGAFDAYHGTLPQPTERFTASDDSRNPFSIMVWQRYAEAVWMDIAQGDVLSRTEARDDDDERHISPLQLTVIRRCIDLWTNPGDVVLSPFAGIGSEGWVALEMGRRFVGAELKASYFAQAARNLREAERRAASGDLLSRMSA